MPNEFKYDVFLSHSSKDKAVVRANNHQPAGKWIERFEEWLADSGFLK